MEKEKEEKGNNGFNLVSLIGDKSESIHAWVNAHNQEFRNGCLALMMTSTLLLGYIGFRSATSTFRHIKEIPSSYFCQSPYIPFPFRGLIGRVQKVKEEDGLILFEHYPYRKLVLYSLASMITPKLIIGNSLSPGNSHTKSIEWKSPDDDQNINDSKFNTVDKVAEHRKRSEMKNQISRSDNLLQIKLFGINYNEIESRRPIYQYMKDLKDKEKMVRIHILFVSDEILYVQLQHGMKMDLAKHIILLGIGAVETESSIERYNLYQNISASSFQYINKQYKALIWRQKVASFLKKGIWRKKETKYKGSTFKKISSWFSSK